MYNNRNPEQLNELFPDIVSDKGLGKLKLENIVKKAIFLAPISYILETIDGKIINKIKGLSKSVKLTIDDFDALLTKDSIITKKQTKWFNP